MILTSISLHNFMSYADARVDLTGIKVACLTGVNGAGKSALLDAVTWALWEQARAPSDELVRLGQREMWVEVCFDLEGHKYRVRRSRQRSAVKGVSKGTLDFQVASLAPEPVPLPSLAVPPEAGRAAAEPSPARGDRSKPVSRSDGSDGPGAARWTALTGTTMRETQRRICELLRLDYQTFINSVYIRQGMADEFMTRPPAERKQVLADILGLSYFDRLQELARDQAKHLKAKTELMAEALSAQTDVEQRLAAANEELSGAVEDLAQATGAMEKAEACATELAATLNDLKLTRQLHESGERRLSELEGDLEAIEARRSELAGKQRQLAELISQAEAIEAEARSLENVKNETAALDEAELKHQELGERQQDLESQLMKLRSRLEVEAEHDQAALEELEQRRQRLVAQTADQDKVTASYQQLRELLATEAELCQRQEAYAQLTARADELKARITEAKIRLEAEIQQKEGAVAELERILSLGAALDEEKIELDEKAEELDRLDAEFQLVEEKGLRLKADTDELASRIHGLEQVRKENLAKISELNEHCDSAICPLCSAPIVDRAAVISRHQRHNEEIEAEIEGLKDRIDMLAAERKDLRKLYLDLKHRLSARKDLDKRIGQYQEKRSALERAQANRERLIEDLDKARQALSSGDYATVERESLVAVKAEIHKLDFDPAIFANLQAQIRMMRHVEGRFQHLMKDLGDLKRIEEELPVRREKVKELTLRLESGSYGSEIRSELEKIQEQMKRLAYDREKHAGLRRQLALLIPAAERLRQLDGARAELPAVEAALDELAAATTARAQELSALEDNLAKWSADLETAPDVEAQAQAAGEELRARRAEREALAARVAVLETRLGELGRQKDELSRIETELVKARLELEDYQYLSECFGKKGIQAVIIENAVPEIEAESNRILSRLSDNRMHVALVTQQKTKAGTVVETLDLLIADELGTRSYELYSGGEAFKVDFAVRVALSRLLARRAGARLETLLIDEGFGSQDEASRQRLVKAINSIRGDFALILVITHIAEIKEMFPVQLHVRKIDGVSQLELMS